MFWRDMPLSYSTLKREAGLSKMLGSCYYTIHCHIPKHSKSSLVTAVRTSYITKFYRNVGNYPRNHAHGAKPLKTTTLTNITA